MVNKTKELPTNNTLPGNDMIQNWSKDKEFYRQAKAKRVNQHYTVVTTMLKGFLELPRKVC